MLLPLFVLPKCSAESIELSIDSSEFRYALQFQQRFTCTRFTVDGLFSHSADQYEYFFPHRPLSLKYRARRRRRRLVCRPTAADDDDDDGGSNVWRR